jgi:hypothetical protein
MAAPASASTQPYLGSEQTYAILCADIDDPRDPRAYTAAAKESSPRARLTGEHWIWLTEVCSGWPKVKGTYTGPWNRRTANPILLVGNTGDPASTYAGSVAMSHDLARARLLTVNGYGHTQLLNPSTCVVGHETEYLRTGVLPPTGIVCEQDIQPYP